MNLFTRLIIISSLIIGFTASAQTYTLGTGTAVNNTLSGTPTTYPAPFNNVDGLEHQQYLILGSELTASGATAGNISSLAFFMVAKNTTTVARNTLTGYTISMKATSATSIIAYDVIGLKQVYNGNFQPLTINGWNTLSFASCFNWDGTSNVLIDICHNSGINKATAGATTQYSTLGFNASISTGIGAVCGGVAGGTTSVNRPNMQITITKPDAAASGSNLSAANIILNQISNVSIIIQNNSCNTLTSAKVGYSFNGGTPVIENFAGSIAPGATGNYTFTVPVVPVALGFAKLKVWVTNPQAITTPDALPANDTLPINNCFVINDPSTTSTSYTGTDFWLGFMQNNDNGVANPLYQMLYLSTAAGSTTVTITTPNLSPAFSTTVAVNSNTITTVQIPVVQAGISLATTVVNAVMNTGVHLVGSTTVPFTVYGLSREKYTADGYLGIPTTALGKDYVIAAPFKYSSSASGNAKAEALIIATKNGTTATVVVPAGTKVVGHPAGSTFTTPVLNAGQTYLIQSDEVSSGGVFATYTVYDLTGLHITANNEIGVLEGNVCANFGYLSGGTVLPDNSAGGTLCGYCDHVVEMAIPTQSWGQTYFLDNFALKTGGSIIRVVNSSAGTNNITITGQPAQTLTGVGAYKDFMVKTAAQIVASKPVYVMEYCTGAACDNGTNTDPFITNILPKEQWGNAYSFLCPTSATQAFTYHYVNILKQGTGKVALDGVFLPNAAFPGSFTQLGTTGVYYGTFSLPAAGGFHTLIGDSAVSAYVYGYTTDDAYGYPASGASLTPIALPVKMLSFSGIKQKDKALLKWSTATEENCKSFVVERSGDGINFSEIGTVAGSMNSSTQKDYTFTDPKPLEGNNYYQLKQIDNNGASVNGTNFVVLNFILNSGGLHLNALQPIPAKDNVSVSFNSETEGEGVYNIYDVTGKRVISGNIANISIGLNTEEVNISALEKGAYIMSLEKNGGNLMMKLIKE